MKPFNLKLSRYMLKLGFLLSAYAANASTPINIDTTNRAAPAVKNQTTAPATTSGIQQSPSFKKPEVLDVKLKNIALGGSNARADRTIKVDYKISILISHPRELLLQRPTDQTPMILYADGFPLKGLNTLYFAKIRRLDAEDPKKIWPDSLWIPFLFKRDSTNKDAWNSMFRLARWYNNHLYFKLSAGWEGMFPLDSANEKVNTNIDLEFYNPYVFWVLIVFYLILISFFVYLCHTTGLIREPDIVNKNPGPYSLSQTQLAFWTVVIIGGFMYLIILTGLTDSLNDTALLLLGISGGTTGAASFIDYFKKQRTTDNDKPRRHKKHRSFIYDILSDGVNISVQRTQTVMWNVVLGMYFLWYVVINKSMPVFSNTLLLLAGVSSLLYLGSKGPENPNTLPANGEQQAGDKPK